VHTTTTHDITSGKKIIKLTTSKLVVLKSQVNVHAVTTITNATFQDKKANIIAATASNHIAGFPKVPITNIQMVIIKSVTTAENTIKPNTTKRSSVAANDLSSLRDSMTAKKKPIIVIRKRIM
jgi:hypothetical protein